VKWLVKTGENHKSRPGRSGNRDRISYCRLIFPTPKAGIDIETFLVRGGRPESRKYPCFTCLAGRRDTGCRAVSQGKTSGDQHVEGKPEIKLPEKDRDKPSGIKHVEG